MAVSGRRMMLKPRYVEHGDSFGRRRKMSGMVILAVGIGMVLLSVTLFIVSIIYRQTAGKKIREALSQDYD